MRDASGDAGEFYTPRPVVKFMVEMLNPTIGETILDPASGTGGFLVETFEYLKKQVDSTEKLEILQRQSIFGGEAKPLPYLLCQMNLLLHGLHYPQIDSGNSLRKKITDISDSDRVDIILTNPPFGGEEERGILNNFPDDMRTSETAMLFLQLIMRKLKRAKPENKGGRAAVVIPKGSLFTTGVSARIVEQLLTDFKVDTVVKLAEGVFAPYTDISSFIIFFSHTTEPTDEIWYYEIPPSENRKKYSKTKPMFYEEFSDIKEWWNNRIANPNCWLVNISDIITKDDKGNPTVNLDFKNPNTIYEKSFSEPELVIQNFINQQNSFLNDLQTIKSEVDKIFLELTEKFEIVPISKVLKQYRVEIWIQDDIMYKQLTISKYDGIKQRGQKIGNEIGRKRQFVVDLDNYPNTVLYTRQTIQADEVIGLAPLEVNGCIATENMPMFTVVDCEPRFIEYYFKSEYFLGQLRRTSAKGTSQQTIHEDTFLTYSIPLPSPEKQKEIVMLLDQINDLKARQKELENTLNSLLPSVLQKVFN